jgi:PadR family transcriptional regulator, regulatory protein AphA
MSNRALTTTSYAILGLLAVKPWPTYELAKQMRRSLHYFWPRAESNLYAEPKRLVAAGLADAREDWNGGRRRTVYSITDAGRRELRAWLARPPSEPRFESEAALRVFLGEHGTKDDLLAAIDALRRDAEAGLEHWQEAAADYAEGRGPFPQRLHVSVLAARLVGEQQAATARWAAWARAEVERWDEPSTSPGIEWGVDALRGIGEPFDVSPDSVSGGS